MRAFRLVLALGVLALVFGAAVCTLVDRDVLRVGMGGPAASAGEPASAMEAAKRSEDVRATIAERQAARLRRTQQSRVSPEMAAHAAARLGAIARTGAAAPRPLDRPTLPETWEDPQAEVRWYEGELISTQARAERLAKLAARMDETASARPEVRERIASELAIVDAYLIEINDKLEGLRGEGELETQGPA